MTKNGLCPRGFDPMRCLCARSKVQVAPSHKAQEPTAAEWGAAAEYTLTLSLPEGWQRHGEQSTELTLAVDYSGDAARIYYKDRACPPDAAAAVPA